MNHANIIHGEGKCPACLQSVHVVGNLQRRNARWVCVPCKTVGVMPLVDDDPTSILGTTA